MPGMSQDEVIELFDRLSNVGRWGPDDELGTINFITPEKRVEAASLVRTGRTFALSHDLSPERSPKNPLPLVHHMLYASHSEPFSCIDTVQIAPHGWWTTHLDATGHIFFEGRMFNGRRAEEEILATGMRFGSVYAFRDGIVTRAVLLDVARVRGRPYLTDQDAISVADLEAAERMAGASVGRGDAVIVRCGLDAREKVEGESDPAKTCGLLPECMVWLHEREVALYGGDCADKEPTGYPRIPKPVHQLAHVVMGLCLLDNVYVEDLAQECTTVGRYEFMLTIGPLRIQGATASAVNPIAIM